MIVSLAVWQFALLVYPPWRPNAPASSVKTAATRLVIKKSPCVIAFIGDSATSSVYTPPGFPALVGRDLGVVVYNLATVSQSRNVASYDIGEALAEEVPKVPPGTTDAVLFLGTDDLNSLASGEDLSIVEKKMAGIIAALRTRKIRVHLITARNYSLDPKFTNPPKENVADWQAKMGRATDAFDDFEVAQGLPTLDIRKHPDLMLSSSYQEGVHFNQTGIKLMAWYVERWFQACPSHPLRSLRPKS